LNILPTPTIEGTIIQCYYFLEVHIYYKGGLTTKKVKALSLPIIVCRPILGAPILAPHQMIIPGGQLLPPPMAQGVPIIAPQL
jgi:hypothetical protein